MTPNIDLIREELQGDDYYQRQIAKAPEKEQIILADALRLWEATEYCRNSSETADKLHRITREVGSDVPAKICALVAIMRVVERLCKDSFSETLAFYEKFNHIKSVLEERRAALTGCSTGQTTR